MSYATPVAGAASTGNNSATGTVGLPSGTVAGRLLLAFLAIAGAGTGGAQPTVSVPSGWTQIGSTFVNQTTTAGSVLAVYYRWATGSDTGPSWSFGSSFKYAARVIGYDGGPVAGAPTVTFANGPTNSSGATSTTGTASTPHTTRFVEVYTERSTTNASYTTPAGTSLVGSQFGTGGAAADLLIVDSGGDVVGSVGADTTTAGTVGSWGSNALIILPSTVTPAAATASISLSAGATTAISPSTASASISLNASAAPTVATSPVDFRASSTGSGNSNVASAANPPGVQAGDFLLVSLTVADGGTGFTAPATPAPAGYQLLGTQTSQSASSGAVGAWYYKWATGADTAPSITLHASTNFKWALAVVAYTGGDGSSAPSFVAGTDPQVSQTSHLGETETISASTWVIESFGIKSSTNTAYTTPAGLVQRAAVFGSGGGAADVVVFDGNADDTGLVGGDTTISAAASTYGVHATIAVPTMGGHAQGAHAALSISAMAITSLPGRSRMGWGISYPVAGPEAALGRPVDFVREYGWIQGLTPTWLNAIAATRRCIVSMKWRTSTVNIVPATDVWNGTTGKYETQIRAFITWFNSLPVCPLGPHVLVFEHEIDAATAQSSGTPTQLNAAFAHCATLARASTGWSDQIGTIVTGFNPTTREPLYTPDYDISDIVGIDLPYVNSYPGASGDSIVGPAFDWFNTNYPSMPLFIGEWGAVAGTGTQRADWITAFEAALTKPRYANCIGAMYWNQGQYALDSAGLAAWALGGQGATGPVGATANVAVTAAANDALKLPVSASATISLTGTANVTSSTGASQPAANITLTGAAAVTLPTTAATAAAAVTLTGAVTAPVVGSAAATAFINLGALSTATGAFIAVPVTTGATIALFASAIGPPITTGVVPINIRARIVDDNGNFELDISGMLAKAEIVRGRTSPNETTIAAAVATLTLDDTAGTFDPDNTTGALAGRLEPAPLGTATLHLDHFVSALGQYIDLFTGGIESLDRIFTGGDYSETTGVFVDQTLDLSKHKPAAGTILPAQLPGDRITQLIGMPSRSGYTWQSRSEGAATQLDRGQKMLGTYTCDGNTSSWDIAVGAAAAEDGLIYFDESGVLVFSGQADRLTTTPVWTVGDQPGQIPAEVDLAFRHSNDDTIVDVAVSTQDGVTALYGPGGLTTLQPGVQFNADVTEQSQLGGWQSAAAKAAYVYGIRSKARRAAPSLHINPAPIQGIWLAGGVPTAYQMSILARISDLLQLTRTPAGGGSQIVANHWIEGYKHTIDASGTWDVTYNVSRGAAPPAGGFWKLGISRLGIDTTLTW